MTPTTNRELLVVTQLDSLHRSALGSITAKIHLMTSGRCFPEEGWSDFVVVILSWWVEEVVETIKGAKQVASLRFMDGPFEALILAKHQHVWTVKFVDDSKSSPLVEYEGEIEPRSIVRSLLAAASKTLEECRKRQFSSRDVDSLVSLRDELGVLLSSAWN